MRGEREHVPPTDGDALAVLATTHSVGDEKGAEAVVCVRGITGKGRAATAGACHRTHAKEQAVSTLEERVSEVIAQYVSAAFVPGRSWIDLDDDDYSNRRSKLHVAGRLG